jgi:sugar phosphate isomerase/epimerase
MVQTPVMPAILLKARPTPAQLEDRLRPEPFDGLELYLDARDLAADDWAARLEAALEAAAPPAGLRYVVEGPVRSLDGSFFSIAADSEANRETLRRVVAAGRILGAGLAVIHAVAPLASPDELGETARDAALAQSLRLLGYYVELCVEAGLRPTIENVPPALQQRERRVMSSALGVPPGEMRWLLEQVPGLGCTLDTSHAQLYVNCLAEDHPDDERLAVVAAHYRRHGEQVDLAGYVDALAPWLAHAHVSNAAGLLGEGLPYHRGGVDLDPVVRQLGSRVSGIVPEIVEPDPDRCPNMRAGARAIRRALGAAPPAPMQ